MSEQLFISEHDEVILPHTYHFSHNIAVRLYDDLVSILKDEKVQKKLAVTLKFSETEKKPKDNEKDIIGWLINNGKQAIADEIVSKHLTAGVISDVCHFIFQSLHSAKKIKMSVAFTLLRKPFLENLIVIEQLLSDEHTFLRKFETKPENFDPGAVKEDFKQKIIADSVGKIKFNFFLTPELIYELRYDKNNPNSFYAMSNLATHLVTTRHPHFKTESSNLNFVFSGQNEWETQLDYFYYFVPLMLLYTTEIVDEYLLQKKIIDLKSYKRRKFIRLIGQILQFDQFDKKSAKGNSTANKLTRALKTKCKSCGKTNTLFKSDLFSLIHNDYILCKHCLVDLYKESNSLNEVINKIMK